MAVSPDIDDREYDKFVANTSGETCVRILNVNDIDWDRIVPTFNSTDDVYEFYKNDVLVKTITIFYTDSTKAVMSEVTKV
jgi:hypothetical protein